MYAGNLITLQEHQMKHPLTHDYKKCIVMWTIMELIDRNQ